MLLFPCLPPRLLVKSSFTTGGAYGLHTPHQPAPMLALPWHEESQALWLFGGLCSNIHIRNCALAGIQGYVGGLGGWSLKGGFGGKKKCEETAV